MSPALIADFFHPSRHQDCRFITDLDDCRVSFMSLKLFIIIKFRARPIPSWYLARSREPCCGCSGVIILRKTSSKDQTVFTARRPKRANERYDELASVRLPRCVGVVGTGSGCRHQREPSCSEDSTHHQAKAECCRCCGRLSFTIYFLIVDRFIHYDVLCGRWTMCVP